MKHTLNALLRDHPGALNRAVSLFRRGGCNIDSLTVATSGTAGISRMTLVVEAEDVQKILKQLDRLIDILQVEVVATNGD
jgi:acetolactate synthase-1/3 small subunit